MKESEDNERSCAPLIQGKVEKETVYIVEEKVTEESCPHIQMSDTEDAPRHFSLVHCGWRRGKAGSN